MSPSSSGSNNKPISILPDSRWFRTWELDPVKSYANHKHERAYISDKYIYIYVYVIF
jgi:hypothetical protein